MTEQLKNSGGCGIRNNQNGAVTIEYALIFPIVILCVCILIFLGFIYYQQILLQTVVSENAQNWAFLWGYDASQINLEEGVGTRQVYESEGLYWHIFSNADKKKEFIEKTIKEQFSKRSILSPVQKLEVEVGYQNNVINQQLKVKAVTAYSFPAKGFFQSMGLSGEIPLSANCQITILDPKEFIHTVDYLLQIYEETGAKHWVEEKCEPLVQILGSGLGLEH